MTLPNEPALQKLQFYVTTPYKCGYLPNKQAQSLIAAPHHLINAEVYSGLIQQGFRRSGKFAYRPHCELCNACIPVRLILDQFNPTRSQKRAYKQHQNLTARILTLDDYPGHFELYADYQALRHPNESSQNEVLDDKDQYLQFLCQSNVESLMIEFRDTRQQLKIVCVVDIIRDGVSAVYTFYDATEQTEINSINNEASTKRTSYGTYAIMWLAEWTKTLHLPYLYLGYWIQNSEKMAYKQAFKPQEKLIDGEWVITNNRP